MNFYTEKRPWGKFEQFVKNEKATVKIITINSNEELSLQLHHKREEYWKVLSGNPIVQIGEKKFKAKKGDEFFIDKETKHRISANDKEAEILEVSLGEFDEKDEIRLEDKYGRKMKSLPNVTLIGIDCIDLKRLQLAADISTKEINFGAVKLLSSIKSDDSRVIQISQIKSIRDYSDFMIKKLNQYVDTEFALVFQYDGFILNPNAWSDEFLKYDYIGSPWYHLGDLHIGNGGFSLRSKKLTKWLSNNWQIVNKRIDPEDVFVSKFARPYLEKEGLIFAPVEIAEKFSKEGNCRSVIWNGEFGFHGINYTDISRWLNKHPEYKKDLTYKLDDYATLMKKYPIYNGTVHTLKFKKIDMKNYKLLSKNNKKYEARIIQDKYWNLDNIKQGHTIVFKRSGVSFKKVSIPAFEKKVRKIEKFESFKDLRQKYPKIYITWPAKISKGKKFLRKILGDLIYPKNEPYVIYWFE